MFDYVWCYTIPSRTAVFYFSVINLVSSVVIGAKTLSLYFINSIKIILRLFLTVVMSLVNSETMVVKYSLYLLAINCLSRITVPFIKNFGFAVMTCSCQQFVV